MRVRTIFVSILPEERAAALAPLSGPPALGIETSRATTRRLARALLLRMVSGLWPIDLSQVRLDAEPSGRLFLAGMDPSAAPFISISHSRGWIACAATEIGPLGIDIELPRPGRNMAGIAAAAFGPLETQRARQSGESGFYRAWTIREAIGKATGEGLRLVTDGIDRAHEGSEQGAWRLQSGPTHWALYHQILEGRLHAAAAVLLPGGFVGDVAIQHWNCDLAAGGRSAAAWP